MNGILGKPYKFIYSSKGFIPSLTDIIALVKKPDGTAFGTFNLTEFSGSIFQGVYSFDLPNDLNDPEGEYSVIVYEQTSGHREISKVSLNIEAPDNTSQENLSSIELELDITKPSMDLELISSNLKIDISNPAMDLSIGPITISLETVNANIDLNIDSIPLELELECAS